VNNKITAQGLALFAPGVEPSFRNDKNKKPNPAAFKRFLLQAKAYVDSHPGQPKLITINA
jgi:hypothetical protein